MAESRFVLDLKKMEPRRAVELCRKVGHRCYAVKIHSLFDELNCSVVEWLKNAGAPRVLLDCKLHDTPDTVAERAAKLKEAGVDAITVHASGQEKMVRAAIEHGPPLVLAVTVLTSLDDDMCVESYGTDRAWAVPRLALVGLRAGAHGLVCSGREVTELKRLCETNRPLAEDGEAEPAGLLVPGTRSVGKDANDQKNVVTPEAAVVAGARWIVLGRQVTDSPDPVAEIDRIERDIEEALAVHGQEATSPEGKV